MQECVSHEDWLNDWKCGYDSREADWEDCMEECYKEAREKNKKLEESGAILITFWHIMPECEDCPHGIEYEQEDWEDDISGMWCTHECLKHKVNRFKGFLGLIPYKLKRFFKTTIFNREETF